MRTILFLLQKEFLQIFRNKVMLRLMFVLPVVQLIVLVNAANMDMKNIRITIVDADKSSMSQRLIQDLDASPFFEVGVLVPTKADAIDLIKRNKTDVVLYIPYMLQHDSQLSHKPSVQIIADAVDATRAQLAYGYLSGIVRRLSLQWQVADVTMLQLSKIQVVSSFWFNPELNFKYYMLPGILVILVTIIGLFLSSMNLVREKEVGTAEQMNVTPVKKYQFIIGKLVPFLVIGIIELALGLIIGHLLYNIPFDGSIAVLFSFTTLYLLAILGLGLLLSSRSETQQQVMLLSYFFLLIFVMMSGVFTAVENMPLWAQKLNYLNPLYYFMNVIRGVLLKGSGFMDLWPEFVSISAYAIGSLSLAIWSYRKTS